VNIPLSLMWPLHDADFEKLTNIFRRHAKKLLYRFVDALKKEKLNVIWLTKVWGDVAEDYSNTYRTFHCYYEVYFNVGPAENSFSYFIKVKFAVKFGERDIECVIEIRPQKPVWVSWGVLKVQNKDNQYGFSYKIPVNEDDVITQKVQAFNPTPLYKHVIYFIKDFWGLGGGAEPLPRRFAIYALKDVSDFENNLKTAMQQQGFLVDFIQTKPHGECQWGNGEFILWWRTFIVFRQQEGASSTSDSFSLVIGWKMEYTFSRAESTERLRNVAPLSPKSGVLTLDSDYTQWGGRSFEEMLQALSAEAIFQYLHHKHPFWVSTASLDTRMLMSERDKLLEAKNIPELAVKTAEIIKTLAKETARARQNKLQFPVEGTENLWKKHLYNAAVLCVAIANVAKFYGKRRSPVFSKAKWNFLDDKFDSVTHQGYVICSLSTQTETSRVVNTYFKVMTKETPSGWEYSFRYSDDYSGIFDRVEDWVVDMTQPPREIVKHLVKEILRRFF